MASHLPNETLEAIFTDLPQHTLAVLTRVSDRFNAVAERLLYTAVSITDVITPTSPSPMKTLGWCNYGMQLDRRGRRCLVQSTMRKLSIRWLTNHGDGHQQSSGGAAPPDPNPLVVLSACERLGEILPTLVGLESLELWLGPANLLPSYEIQRLVDHPHYLLQQRGPSTGVPILQPMHAVERVLWNCRLPSLKSCSLGAQWIRGVQPYTPILTKFLNTLTSLRHLRISDLVDHSSLYSLSPNRLSPFSSLTLLTSFRGSPGGAAALIPGRPVQYLALTGQDSDLNEVNLEQMTRGSLPLKVLDLSAMSMRIMLLQNISVHFGGIDCLKVKLALRHTLHYADSGIQILTGLSCVLSAFSQLSHLDLSPMGVDAYGIGRADVSEELGVCKEWSKACPSLRRITFPSQVEWVMDDEDDIMDGGMGGGWRRGGTASALLAESGIGSGNTTPVRF